MKPVFQYQGALAISRLISDKFNPHDILAREIGPAYADYRRRWDQARFFKELPSFPLHVDYELKFSCNLHCPMCLMSLPPEKRRAYGEARTALPTPAVLELIRQGADLGQAALGFGGLWEPLLSPDLPLIISQARRSGLVDVMFNTNGQLLDDRIGPRLIEAGLTKLMISLDAIDPATYRRLRAGGELAAVERNVETFLERRLKMGSCLPLVRLSFCLNGENEAELEPFLQRWRDAADFFSLQNYGRYPTDHPLDFATTAPPPPSGPCPQPFKRLLVRHNGQVLPCCDASGLEMAMGNIYNTKMADIWAGEAINRLRRDIQAGHWPAACQACRNKFAIPA